MIIAPLKRKAVRGRSARRGFSGKTKYYFAFPAVKNWAKQRAFLLKKSEIVDGKTIFPSLVKSRIAGFKRGDFGNYFAIKNPNGAHLTKRFKGTRFKPAFCLFREFS